MRQRNNIVHGAVENGFGYRVVIAMKYQKRFSIRKMWNRASAKEKKKSTK